MTSLRQRMLEDLQIRHYSPTTIRIYLRAVSEFAQHFGAAPDRLRAEHIRQYQLFLVKEKKVSRPKLVQSVCALRFFCNLETTAHYLHVADVAVRSTASPLDSLDLELLR